MNAFFAAFLHDLRALAVNPSTVSVTVLVWGFAWVFNAVLGFWPAFSTALLTQLGTAGLTSIGLLSVMGEEREHGAWGTVARTGAPAAPLLVGKAAACLCACLFAAGVSALLSGMPPTAVPLVMLASLATTLPALLLSLALGLLAPNQEKANGWGALIFLPNVLPSLGLMVGVHLWFLPSCAVDDALGATELFDLAPLHPGASIGVAVAWTAIAGAFAVATWRSATRKDSSL